jgi:nucleotide-binding universal stress UspA family protein
MSWLPKQTVLVPIDFSEESFNALDVARSLVQDLSSLHLVHVTEDLIEHAYGDIWGETKAEERTKVIQEYLYEKLKTMSYQDLQFAIRVGSPPVEILSYAKEIQAELIVMPSHGRTGIKHFALGSVAERVVRRAHCPVLVLRAEDKKKH